ncbi:four helix bundle protein [Planctomycetaceae bacterium]|nr:four helix bundle protein [Planctomycetaceae bacterium]MDC0274376.1 four helix bundle protein [Planctomycetaceae bacterium]MDG2391541.1 four helix bundle protein [Planctomycetaceae bacterium]
MFQSFEDLEVWKRSCQLAVKIYEVMRDSRDYGLRDQMQRAAVSIASNIAEGSEGSNKEFARYLKIASGSAAELRTQTYIASRVGLIELEQMREIIDECQQISKMIYGLRKSLNTEN